VVWGKSGFKWQLLAITLLPIQCITDFMIRKPSLKHESGERDVQGAENKKEGLVD